MGVCNNVKMELTGRQQDFELTDRRDIRLGLCGVVFMECTKSNLTDSGSNPQHQFQGIVTPESRDDTVQAAPETQPMKLTDIPLATGWLNREYRNACMPCSAEAFPVPGAISLPLRRIKFLGGNIVNLFSQYCYL